MKQPLDSSKSKKHHKANKQKRSFNGRFKKDQSKQEINLNVSNFIADSNSFNHNLVNVVSGINHEVSPWLGGAVNTIARLKKEMVRELMKCPSCQESKEKWLEKLEGVLIALSQAAEIMAMVSFNVKRLKKHTVEKTSVLNTVRSWFSVIFINDTIKGVLDQTQIIIDEPSLSFLAWHSPMLLSQVFLNLVKNSIDHNPKMIHTLQIRIYGGKDALIIEDNGVGVKNSLLQSLFVPEVTTKIDGDLHGLGLAICKEYCTIMGADISAENVKTHGLRVRIRFAQD